MALTCEDWITQFKRLLQRFDFEAIINLDFTEVIVYILQIEEKRSENTKIISCSIKEAIDFVQEIIQIIDKLPNA